MPETKDSVYFFTSVNIIYFIHLFVFYSYVLILKNVFIFIYNIARNKIFSCVIPITSLIQNNNPIQNLIFMIVFSNHRDLITTLKLRILKCFPVPDFDAAHAQHCSLQPKGAAVGAKWG